ncbi:MAG: hypothetical protein K6C35_11355 [Eubacterium sp.]|nr:hypothetical protein [Eubacterium sp.]
MSRERKKRAGSLIVVLTALIFILLFAVGEGRKAVNAGSIKHVSEYKDKAITIDDTYVYGDKYVNHNIAEDAAENSFVPVAMIRNYIKEYSYESNYVKDYDTMGTVQCDRCVLYKIEIGPNTKYDFYLSGASDAWVYSDLSGIPQSREGTVYTVYPEFENGGFTVWADNPYPYPVTQYILVEGVKDNSFIAANKYDMPVVPEEYFYESFSTTALRAKAVTGGTGVYEKDDSYIISYRHYENHKVLRKDDTFGYYTINDYIVSNHIYKIPVPLGSAYQIFPKEIDREIDYGGHNYYSEDGIQYYGFIYDENMNVIGEFGETSEGDFVCLKSPDHYNDGFDYHDRDDLYLVCDVPGSLEKNYFVMIDGYGLDSFEIKDAAEMSPEIVSQPTEIKVVRGNNAVATIKAKGYGLEYDWSICYGNDDDFISPDVKGYYYNGATFKFPSVPGKYGDPNGALVKCTVYNNSDEVESEVMVVKTLPVISGQPSNQSVEANSEAVYKVKARTLKAEYQWEVSSDNGKTWLAPDDAEYQKAELRIKAAPARNGAKFRCKVTNGSWSEYSKIVTLKVLPKIHTDAKDKTAYYGDKAAFYVTVQGVNIEYQWEVSADGKKWKDSTAEGNATRLLKVTATKSLNGRKFRCRITSNGKTIYSRVATLTTKSNIVRQPSDCTVKAGKKAFFSVGAEGGSLSYSWEVSGDNGKTWKDSKASNAHKATLSFTTSKKMNGYKFRCKVTNGDVSTYTVPVKLTVE